MPLKPKATRIKRNRHKGTQREVPNEAVTVADGALTERGAHRMHYAIDFYLKDIESGQPTRGRYTRTVLAVMKYFTCDRREADRAMQRSKIYLAEKYLAEMPTKRVEACMQLQRIADANEQNQPLASVAAIREQSKIMGWFAPKKIELTQGTQETLDLRAVIDCLDSAGRAALDVVLAQIEAAKASGRLALPPPPDEPVDDAELVDDERN